jgi:histone H3/H4
MDAGAHKLLETVILKTLHAHSFTRSSSQASLALTDLLSRYLVLLATTCSQYAQHAGRLNITVRDAMCVLDELGVSMDELHEYCGTEGDELARYSGHCAKRQEDLNEFKGQSDQPLMICIYFLSILTRPPALSIAGRRASCRA